jgi:hypothetical protein
LYLNYEEKYTTTSNMVEKNMERFIYSTNGNSPMPSLLPLLVLLFLLLRSFMAHGVCRLDGPCNGPSTLDEERARSVVDLDPIDAKRYWLAMDASRKRMLICSERLYLKKPWYETQDVMSEVAYPLDVAKTTVLPRGSACWYATSGVALAEDVTGGLTLIPKTRRVQGVLVGQPYIVGHLDNATVLVV